MSTHAVLSPSSAHRWLQCPASIAAEDGLPNTSSVHSQEGTAAHALAEACLLSDTKAEEHIGKEFEGVEVTDEMADHVQVYIDLVHDYHAHTKGPLLVEQRLPLWHITGEAGARGTADAVVVVPEQRELIVIDLKFGRGVAVSAEENPQLMLYALGAIEEFGVLYDFTSVRMVISQPRIQIAPSEYVMSREALEQWGLWAADRAELTKEEEAEFVPGEKQCHWCKAKAGCKALAEKVLGAITDGFVDLDAEVAPQIEPAIAKVKHMDTAQVAALLPSIDLIEGFCKAVRAQAEASLLQGQKVTGYKLVTGKRGNRKWKDEQEAISILKSMRLKIEEMYDLKLISPTSAEKLLADTPRRWTRLSTLIVQEDGNPTVVPASDKRAEWVAPNVSDAFDDLNGSDLI